MKLKICLIIICLIIFGCENKEEPVYVIKGEGKPYLNIDYKYNLINTKIVKVY